MAPPNSSVRDLARRLLELEAGAESDRAGDHPANEALRIAEKLRQSLTRFAGPDGFAALLRRALKLARADVPALRDVTVKPDGSLEGLETLFTDGHNDAAVAVITHLLNLLVTFIGESLTLQLVRDAWPQIAQTSLAAEPPLVDESH